MDQGQVHQGKIGGDFKLSVIFSFLNCVVDTDVFILQFSILVRFLK